MKRLYFLFFLLSVAFPADAQLSKITESIFGAREADRPSERDDSALADSLKISELTLQLQQMKLKEIIYRDELMRLKDGLATDSLRRAGRKSEIDSLRAVTKGVPLVIGGDTLFSFHADLGGISPVDRAANAERNVEALGRQRGVTPDSIYLLPVRDGLQVEIMYQRKVIASVTENDALWLDMTIDSLSRIEKDRIVAAVKALQHKHSLLQTVKRIALFLLLLAAQIFLFYGINRLYKKVKILIKAHRHQWFKPVSIRGYELLTAARQANITVMLINIFRYVLIIIQLLAFIPLIFSIFPQTNELASVLLDYITNPVKQIFSSIIHYIPNLFTIIIIWLCIRYLIKGIAFVAKEVESERLKLPGFYTDWAIPTYQIIKFLLYAFMIAMIYPYLPGSSSGIFQGVSIFVGLIAALGSSTVIGNILAGLIITYMRPFKLGDHIKLNDTTGNVIEKTPFVTRIKTTKNEIITIPNSFILSSRTTNYSASARDYGLIIHSSVSIGYEVPWRKAHECLIRAAKNTKDTLKDREPFVLDLGLEDYYNSYQINVYISDADKMHRILTELHSNIQDVLFEEGIDLESPLLMSGRKEPEKKWQHYM
ncbi:MAG: mechanosensitive ion channel family protein [Bacteroidales bacterium]|jgi:small-conductance mechanosensitive channel|nr:mechanosensitive ion channel family protein [Bacteroidales bacterium]